MAGGPILPSSVYLGGASGNLSPTFYVPGVNTNTAGALEGIGVVGTLGANAPAVLQFNMPEVLPSGTLKLRILSMANAGSTQVGKVTIADGSTSAGANIGATTLTTEASANPLTINFSVATADQLIENKVTLTDVPFANDIVTILATFNNTGWTLTAASVHQFSLVWE